MQKHHLLLVLFGPILMSPSAHSQSSEQLSQAAIERACPKIYKMIKKQDKTTPLFMLQDVTSSGIRTKGLELAICDDCNESDYQKIKTGITPPEKVRRVYTQNVPRNNLNPIYTQTGSSFQGDEKDLSFTDVFDKLAEFSIEKCNKKQLKSPLISQSRLKMMNKYINYEEHVVTPKPEFKKCMQNWMVDHTLKSYNFKKPLRNKLVQAKSKEEFLHICEQGFKQSAFDDALQAFLSLVPGENEYDVFINDSSRYQEQAPSLGEESDTQENPASSTSER